MQKTCTTCKIIKIYSEFPITKNKYGKIYYRNKCKKCTSRYYCNKMYTKNKNLYTCDYKTCSLCKELKLATIDNFNKRNGKNGLYFMSRCKSCIYKYQQTYKQKRNTNHAERRKIDPNFKLRQYTSTSIRSHLIKKLSSKNKESILNYLPYSIQELKDHIEKQFESWMTWDNWGTYNAKLWDDNDQSTWKWQIDHIIPHSNFIYVSLSDASFKECWSLNNLRPYSAKQNILDKNRK